MQLNIPQQKIVNPINFVDQSRLMRDRKIKLGLLPLEVIHKEKHNIQKCTYQFSSIDTKENKILYPHNEEAQKGEDVDTTNF